MKKTNVDIQPQFIVNKLGKKITVILDINTFERLME